jgi:hypothetical protein
MEVIDLSKNARAPLPLSLSLSHTLRAADDFQIRAAAPDLCGRHRCSTTLSTGGTPPLHLPSVMPATASGALGGARPPPCASAPGGNRPPLCPNHRLRAHTHADATPTPTPAVAHPSFGQLP